MFVANVLSFALGLVIAVLVIHERGDNIVHDERKYTGFLVIGAILVLVSWVIYSNVQALSIAISMAGLGLGSCSAAVLGYVMYIKATTPPPPMEVVPVPEPPRKPEQSTAEEIDKRIDAILRQNRDNR